MALAYTPGLKRKELYVLRKTRRLPIPGEVVVKKGDEVSHTTVVARTNIPGQVQTINAIEVLDLMPDPRTRQCDLDKFMLKKTGSTVEKGELIAQKTEFFGLIKKFVRSPIKGTIEYVSNVTGQIILREPPTPLEAKAYIPGTIVDVMPKEGVTVECLTAFIQGIFGIGGETHGELMVVVESQDDVLTAEQIVDECDGKVLVGGSMVEEEALRRAVEAGVKGIIVGGIEENVLTKFIGYRIGVAITGHEQVGLTLIVTEGLSKMRMSKATFELLKRFEGRLACINGATQIRAGVIRPEIIIPREEVDLSKLADLGEETEFLSQGLETGTPIRIIREPYFGALGHVVGLPVELQVVETESLVRVLEAELDDGRRVIVPRANVELIEE